MSSAEIPQASVGKIGIWTDMILGGLVYKVATKATLDETEEALWDIMKQTKRWPAAVTLVQAQMNNTEASGQVWKDYDIQFRDWKEELINILKKQALSEDIHFQIMDLLENPYVKIN